jgi:hypothetical protein
VSNPSSEGIGPVKALNPIIEKIVQANECIFVAQIKEVERQEGLTQVDTSQPYEQSKLGGYRACQLVKI